MADIQSRPPTTQILLAYKLKAKVETLLIDAEKMNKRFHSPVLTKNIWSMRGTLNELNRVLAEIETTGGKK